MVETLRARVERVSKAHDMPPWLVSTFFAMEIEAGRYRVTNMNTEECVRHLRTLTMELLIGRTA